MPTFHTRTGELGVQWRYICSPLSSERDIPRVPEVAQLRALMVPVTFRAAQKITKAWKSPHQAQFQSDGLYVNCVNWLNSKQLSFFVMNTPTMKWMQKLVVQNHIFRGNLQKWNSPARFFSKNDQQNNKISATVSHLLFFLSLQGLWWQRVRYYSDWTVLSSSMYRHLMSC